MTPCMLPGQDVWARQCTLAPSTSSLVVDSCVHLLHAVPSAQHSTHKGLYVMSSHHVIMSYHHAHSAKALQCRECCEDSAFAHEEANTPVQSSQSHALEQRCRSAGRPRQCCTHLVPILDPTHILQRHKGGSALAVSVSVAVDHCSTLPQTRSLRAFVRLRVAVTMCQQLAPAQPCCPRHECHRKQADAADPPAPLPQQKRARWTRTSSATSHGSSATRLAKSSAA